jgi:endoglucanase
MRNYRLVAARGAKVVTPRALFALAALTVAFCSPAHVRTAPTRVSATVRAPEVHVSGNHLVNSRGRRVVLRGVNRSGGEYQCVKGHGIWDGPMNQAAVTAMKQWHINAVRIPLNEACWNGQSYIDPNYRGSKYQSAVEAYVHLLTTNGIISILDLQWSDGTYKGPYTCNATKAICQKPMPDSAQSIPFWRSVAQAFANNQSAIFDIFGEPFPDKITTSEGAAWRCWLRGGKACAGISYKAAGIQTLVNVIRSVGARNVIMAGGLHWADDLTEWLSHRPADPDHNLVASWHTYNFNPCASLSCWNNEIKPVIAKVPVIVDEIGETDCTDRYIGPLMAWLDARATSYLAWAWNADFNCNAGPGLITRYTGSPTAYGRGYRNHLLSIK